VANNSIPGREISRQIKAEYTLIEHAPAGHQTEGCKFLETSCVDSCPRMYRIDNAHPSFAEVQAGLDCGDRSVIFCYHHVDAQAPT